MQHPASLYPILTEPRLVSPLWGGTRLAAWLGVQADRPRVGESWQVYEENRITNGPLAGQTLREAAATLGAALLGTRTAVAVRTRTSRCWPSSSMRRTPSPCRCTRTTRTPTGSRPPTGFHGKTEAWHVLAAEPGALVELRLYAAHLGRGGCGRGRGWHADGPAPADARRRR